MVAYGKQTKESLTGSVSEVKAKDIKDITTANVVQGMTGKVAGVQIATTNGLPGEEPTVRFRGLVLSMVLQHPCMWWMGFLLMGI